MSIGFYILELNNNYKSIIKLHWAFILIMEVNLMRTNHLLSLCGSLDQLQHALYRPIWNMTHK